ncbi:hypothetical protein [Virgibacillus natechei]|nr:hypothetical protein [Virgibacillus natechei]UZD13154.1 hypothetical protein OLD84_00820 [Virgibacillus natechei]
MEQPMAAESLDDYLSALEDRKKMNELLPYKIGKRVTKELKRIRKTDQNYYRKMKKGDLKGYYYIDVSHNWN